MLKKDRRLAPRMPVNGQAYVNLDPDNGGTILNISEGGLCFQSTAPVQRIDTIRFWFSYRRVDPDAGMAWQAESPTRGVSRFIEAHGELAWIDDARTCGGLRFTNLRPEAREQLREWICQPALVRSTATMTKPVPLFPFVKRAHADALRKASLKLEILLRQIQSAKLWKGFSGGLVTGVIASALTAGVFVLLSHTRELGDSLVEFGERLGGRPTPQHDLATATVDSTAALATLSVPQVHAPNSSALPADPASQAVAPVSIAVPLSAKASPSPSSTNENLRASQLELSAPTSRSSFAFKAPDPPRINATATRLSLPGIAESATPDTAPNIFRPLAPGMDLAGAPTVYVGPSKADSVIMRSEKFLEIGKFKEKLLADKTTGQLSQRGFPTTVVPRSRLFGKSYQVLVGPFGNDRDAETAHKNLASLGFTPRSYERGKRDFNLPTQLRVGNTRMPVGYCLISWESYLPDAIVKFEDEKGSGPIVQAKWVRQGIRYDHNAIAYQRNNDGSRILLEIRFSGMAQTLVFPANSNN